MDASKAGYGIEFDVRPSRDGVPMVFHDKTLDRMTCHSGAFEDRSAAELADMSLENGSAIITLETLLMAWPGVCPLLCEMKIDGETDAEAFAKTVGKQLLAHHGPAAAMSFNPLAVKALPSGLMRGQLIDALERTSPQAFEASLSAISPATADYVACHTSDVETVAKWSKDKGLPVITWTVKDRETFDHLAPLLDAQIFEGFIPALDPLVTDGDM